MSSNEGGGRSDEPSTGLKVALGVVAVLALLYSVVIATRPLFGVSIVVWLFGAYLLWRFVLLARRFVRAVERIADAMEESGANVPREREREV
ncbi:hypothetical protein [Halorussus lipolyticus]|uniref:hypothetical protein n=1 Tax=Halorussus lipolyticus TaxID=3034024 RepID=UPI0023E75BD4|nr:hypothetical protein [Halorussus sp. DT80]